MNPVEDLGLHIEFLSRPEPINVHLVMSGKDDFRIRKSFPGEIGRGTIEYTSLSEELGYLHYKCFDISQIHHARMEPLQDRFWFTFNLSPDTGSVGIENLPEPLPQNPGDSYILGPKVIGNQTILPGRILHELSIFASPELIRSLVTSDGQRISDSLESFFSECKDECFYLTGWTSSQMRICIRQLLGNTIGGRMGHVYAESKVLELIILRLDQQFTPGRSISHILMKRDVEIINNIRRILDKKFENPPSLNEIARENGINTTKLKEGFKSLFGKTIFSYIRSRRMDSAFGLIYKGECTVSEAANRVGYRSVSAFTRAFEGEYGVSPGALRPGKVLKL